jgi:hypothetical protein
VIVLLIQHLHGIVSLIFNTTHGDEGEYARLEGEEDEDGDSQKHRRQFADEGQGGVEIGWSGFTYVSTAVTYAQHWSYKSYVCKTAAKRLTNA